MSVLLLSIILKDFFLGSKIDTLYPFVLRAFTHALPLSKLTDLSPDVPPSTTKILLLFIANNLNF